MGNKVIGIIIDFVKALQSKDRALISIESNRTYKISSPKYLLGQILRQYELEQNQYYYSTSAKLLWEKLSTQDMWNYSYRQYVHCENDEPVLISEYTGNGNVPREKRKVQRGDGFIFRDVFHDEHMIPISLIIDELVSLPNTNEDSVKAILGNIYICRILKSEDRTLPIKYKRPFDLQEVISMYNVAGIEINRRA